MCSLPREPSKVYAARISVRRRRTARFKRIYSPGEFRNNDTKDNVSRLILSVRAGHRRVSADIFRKICAGSVIRSIHVTALSGKVCLARVYTKTSKAARE